MYYAKVPGKTPGSYTMDHTAASYVFDRDGKLRLFVRDGSPGPWVHDLKLLVDCSRRAPGDHVTAASRRHVFSLFVACAARRRRVGPRAYRAEVAQMSRRRRVTAARAR